MSGHDVFTAVPERPFGQLLRAERLHRGMSQGQLARMVNYSKSHLSRVESGEKRATSTLARACDEILQTGGLLQRSVAWSATGASRTRPGQQLSQLPIGPPRFVGRTGELGTMQAYLEGRVYRPQPSAPVVIVGGAGTGKTALAVHWAYRAARRFHDGVLFADLNGFSAHGAPTAPDTILEGFLIALGIPRESVPSGLSERAAMYRNALSGKQVLVVLDNAASAEQARPMLCGSAGGGSLVVVTSRNRLSGLVIREGAHRITLGALHPEEATAFIGAMAREAGLRAEPAAAAHVARLFGYLPLALNIVAHRAMANRDPGFKDLLSRLQNGSSALDALSIWGDETLTMRDSLRGSYRGLTDDLARAFKIVGAGCAGGPGQPDRGGAVDARLASMWLDVTPAAALDILDALAETSLIARTDDGSYRCHPLCGAFAAELAAVPQLAA